MARLRRTWMFGLLTFMLFVAGCVEMEWETVVGPDGDVEHTAFRFITDNEDLFADAWNDLQSELENERAEFEALSPYLQVNSHSDGNRYVIEVAADFEGARQSGVDLEAYTRNSSAFNVVHEVLEGTGTDPETGLVYADYVFHPSEEFSDPLLRMLMADMGYAGPVMRTITHMPGEIVSDVNRNDAYVTLLTPSSVQTEVSLTELNRTVAMRIESDPADRKTADASPVTETGRRRKPGWYQLNPRLTMVRRAEWNDTAGNRLHVHLNRLSSLNKATGLACFKNRSSAVLVYN